jgi:redox-sensitive bicupin YhaK (pirin superfamily)
MTWFGQQQVKLLKRSPINREEGAMTTDVITTKGVLGVYQAGSTHMVGDGFPVRNLFPSNDLDLQVDPFLMLDYAGPRHFPPTDQPRGVGEHPHRGFETVTIMYDGAVAHRDSAGNAGVIGPGDVQWMTAASGVVHEELHEAQWAKQGGRFQAIQLWVNLPQAHKMSAPRYQTLLNADIPAVSLADGAGVLRVIAGTFQRHNGPARTVTPVELYDVRLHAGARLELSFPEGHATSVFVLQGRVAVNGAIPAGEAELVVCKRQGSLLVCEASQDSRLLILSGEPINEPIARYGPFVMNTKAELVQAAEDYQAGRMGHLS